ncbi:Zn-dependent exopeptidase M28 [bacterium]|nr:MAG: Zn-dependent exopeptidase M28 [bacterium]
MNRRHRLWRHVVSALLYCLPAVACAQSPLIQEVVDRVDRDSLVNTVRVLTGETGSTHGGTSDTIYSRFEQAGTHGLATDYLKMKLESYGLSTRLQPYTLWSFIGTNVLAEQRGTVTPGRVYILCAHYDSYSGSPDVAPGADDNASGCAAVLEAARVLSRYKTACTVLYALWDEEESGRIGSLYYLKDSLDRQDTIMGAVNLDMIGYDGNGDSLMEIHAQNVANSGALADTAALVQRLYGVGLKTRVYYPTGNGQSDHGAFWMLGYGAIMIIEALRNG